MPEYSDVAARAIEAVNRGEKAYCKFLSANDTGQTGGHQSGIYVAKPAVPILFDEPGIKGENKDKWVKIHWMDGSDTDSRFIYYGQGTRNEYRITNFNRGFEYLRPEHTGDLVVLVQNSADDYEGYFLQTEDEINDFLDAFSMSPANTNTLIEKSDLSIEYKERSAFLKISETFKSGFPSSDRMSSYARQVFDLTHTHSNDITDNPDKLLIEWTATEYDFFRFLESKTYGKIVKAGFKTVDEFVDLANQVLNRRKSRAGKSLEHHLAAIFDANEVHYTPQPHTEGNKRPDFILPSIEKYHDLSFEMEGLTYLGAKTTCKDRWRQILNEANRIPEKHLFTLQQGISPQQMDEMKEEKVTLVVPQEYIRCYPTEKRDMIINLRTFIEMVKEKDQRYGY